MKLYREERSSVAEWYVLRGQPIENVARSIDLILAMDSYCLWKIENTDNLWDMTRLRERQMLAKSSSVPWFRDYASDPDKTVPGGFVITAEVILYSPNALWLHENRDSVHMIVPEGKNFYTDMNIWELLFLLLRKRNLRMAQFDFATSQVLVQDGIAIEALRG